MSLAHYVTNLSYRLSLRVKFRPVTYQNEQVFNTVSINMINSIDPTKTDANNDNLLDYINVFYEFIIILIINFFVC